MTIWMSGWLASLEDCVLNKLDFSLQDGKALGRATCTCGIWGDAYESLGAPLLHYSKDSNTIRVLSKYSLNTSILARTLLIAEYYSKSTNTNTILVNTVLLLL
jgi:hypothetical protein